MIIKTIGPVEFLPMELVIVRAFGLNYHGRVIGIHVNAAGGITYNVEFPQNGDIKNKYFFGDELEGMPSVG